MLETLNTCTGNENITEFKSSKQQALLKNSTSFGDRVGIHIHQGRKPAYFRVVNHTEIIMV